MRRSIAVAVAAAMVCTTAVACARDKGDKAILRKAISDTRRASRQFVYIDKTSETSVQVNGAVEDDFRYRTRLLIDGQPVEDEVVRDDALATRVIDVGRLPAILREDLVTAATTPDAAGNPVISALATQRWVVDRLGAPPLFRSATDRRRQGDDPLFDAMTALDYVARAVEASQFAARYQHDALEPVYKPKEDPFPAPKRDSEIVRYDLKEQRMPSRGAVGATGNQRVPTAENFRKMAIYVRDGRIVQVLEVIDVAGKLKELKRNFGLREDITPEEAVTAINAVRSGQGTDVMRLREMTLQFSAFGAPHEVVLPTDAVAGDLTVVRYRGRPKPTTTSA